MRKTPKQQRPMKAGYDRPSMSWSITVSESVSADMPAAEYLLGAIAIVWFFILNEVVYY